jgi:hypothetical protein
MTATTTMTTVLTMMTVVATALSVVMGTPLQEYLEGDSSTLFTPFA